MTETLDLYTTKDVADVRTLLIKEQNGLSAMTSLPLTRAVLDHCHSKENNQLVRAVINSNENVALGRLEGLYGRYVGYWYEGSYPEFLRLAASYIDSGVDSRFRHPMWIKKINTSFNALSEGKKDAVLLEMNRPVGKNAAERKKYFNDVILKRELGYTAVLAVIKKFK